MIRSVSTKTSQWLSVHVGSVCSLAQKVVNVRRQREAPVAKMSLIISFWEMIVDFGCWQLSFKWSLSYNRRLGRTSIDVKCGPIKQRANKLNIWILKAYLKCAHSGNLVHKKDNIRHRHAEKWVKVKKEKTVQQEQMVLLLQESGLVTPANLWNTLGRRRRVHPANNEKDWLFAHDTSESPMLVGLDYLHSKIKRGKSGKT